MAEYCRPIVDTLVSRMNEPRRFIQMLVGPRQTGKSTALRQALARIDIPSHVALASIDSSSRDWLRAQWLQARNFVTDETSCAVLVIDEVQLVSQWSAVVKELWDEDAWTGLDLRVVLSGSSSLLLQKGLAEGLTGRFEIIRSTHWSLAECRQAFGYSLDGFLFFGGYPGGAPLKGDKQRWLDYLNDAVIEPSISKDVIALEEVRKPALMRKLFSIGAPYSGQELSYRKILGQLDDAGNTTTIAHYLDLLDGAGLLCGVQKYDPKLIRKKASSPRFLVYDTALMTATYGTYRDFLLTDPDRRGRLVESAVGACLLARAKQERFEVHWWREGVNEVDFVLTQEGAVTAIEVKSGRIKSLKGMTAFINEVPHAKSLVVGSSACPLEQFLAGEFALF
ncbi:AAA family ATPase [Eggerthellaceae bacterium zg-887]|uniref:ATP-binding protein n=1 Tax=Xiamenia xianingshaonis TaxID=2682776 RepID=UPI00140C5CFF|nr:AAA family ATPase [Xiamenia xianingshaonis]NHM16670.1 AAA family ATPase [Xiamenia xianingshaonis]